MNPSAKQRTALAKAFDPVIGDKVNDSTADVASYRVPGLPDDAVWKVMITDMDRPLQAYVGLWPDGTARALSDDQPAFFDLVQAHGGVEVGDPATALDYVIAFLEATRGPTVLVQPIRNLGDVRWRPGSTDEEEQKAAFLDSAPQMAPTVTPAVDGYRVHLWLVVDQRIQVNSFDVGANGSIEGSFRIVSEDLPLPILR